MADLSLELVGDEEFDRALARFPVEMDRELRPTMTAAGEILRGAVATYPPGSEANMPSSTPGASWYERGRGTWYIRKTPPIGPKNYGNSEVLGRSWTTELRSAGRDLLAVIGTKVSYARAVQDEEKQSPWHALRGWVTVQEVIRRKRAQVQAFFDRMVKRIIRRLGL